MTFPDATSYLLFLGTATVVLLIPGPAVLYIIARSIEGGRTAGIVSALGIGVGNFFHVVAAVAGVSALIAASAVAFSVVKYAGAVYLIILGVRRLLRADKTSSDDHGNVTRSLRQIFRQGVIVNVLNPKIALFFLAFLPQFTDPSRGSVGEQIFVLGTSLVLLGIVTDGLYGLLVGTVGGWLKKNRSIMRAERWVSGATYVALGVGSAATGSPNK